MTQPGLVLRVIDDLTFFTVQFGAVPVHVVLLVQHLQHLNGRRNRLIRRETRNRHGGGGVVRAYTPTCDFLKLSSSSAVALKSCLATASILASKSEVSVGGGREQVEVVDERSLNGQLGSAEGRPGHRFHAGESIGLLSLGLSRSSSSRLPP